VYKLPLLAPRQILAIAAVTDIAINARDRPAPAREIALRLDLPRSHVEPLLKALARNGIVKCKRGRSGGYILARKPDLISADDIVRAMTDIEDVIVGSEIQSMIGIEVVIPALRPAEKAVTEALQHLTVDCLVHYAQG
jgi:Rrf2 family protein